jgi:hypothetical protein
VKAIFAFCTLVLVAGAALAHHSFAMFDDTQTRVLEGTVRVFEFNYPHSWLWINVADGKGGSVPWGFESAGPFELNKISGWTKTSVKRGDKVAVTFCPLKSGQNGGAFKSVKLPDGRVLVGQPFVCANKAAILK